MDVFNRPAQEVQHPSKFKGWIICAAALLSFSAGSLFTAYLTHVRQVRADSNRVFELMIYHTLPGKAHELEDLFRGDSKLMAQHGINVIGFWVPSENPEWKDNTFVYVVDFPSREEAKKRWIELHADPATRQYVEPAKLIIEQVNGNFHVDEIYMRPSDFSALK
jgi:hypothetical protein